MLTDLSRVKRVLSMTAGCWLELVANIHVQDIREGFEPFPGDVVEMAALAGDPIGPGGVQAPADEATVDGSRSRLTDKAVDRPAAGGQQFREQQTQGHGQWYLRWAVLTIVGKSATIGLGLT